MVKIPKQGIVEYILAKKVKALPIESQADLTAIVTRELKTIDTAYAISGKRLRMIALDMPHINVEIAVKQGAIPENCPVCNEPVTKMHMKNLAGKKVLYKITCSHCPYQSQGRNTAPKNYCFRWK